VKPRGNSWNLGAFLSAQLDDSRLDPFEFRVYLHLCRRANDEQRAWPSQASIAETCVMSERKVRDVLATLEERGWIGREEQRRSDGSRTTDLVTVIGLEASNRHHVPGVGQDVPVLPAPRAAQEGIPYEGVPSEGLTSSSVVPFMGAAHPASKSAEEGLTLREIADSLQPGSKAAGTWRYLRNLRDENSARAKSILLASKDLWCGVVTLPGRVEDNVRVMAETLDEFGLGPQQRQDQPVELLLLGGS
jgi:DNA-binding MarR family transcriptional regulator